MVLVHVASKPAILKEVDMRRLLTVLAIFIFAVATTASAQGSICRDGTVSKATGRGACSHHGGVAKKASPRPSSTDPSSGDSVLPNNTTTRASAAPRASARTEQTSSVKVWVNTKSGVYHCPGTRWYGATKSGEYTTEREARANGDRPAYGRSCS